jgi:hypothetical protein
MGVMVVQNNMNKFNELLKWIKEENKRLKISGKCFCDISQAKHEWIQYDLLPKIKELNKKG